MDKTAEFDLLMRVYQTRGKRALDEALRKFERKAKRHGNIATFVDLLNRVQSRDLTTEKLMETHRGALEKKNLNLKHMTVGILAVADLVTVEKADAKNILNDEDVVQAFAFLKNMGGKALADKTISLEKRREVDEAVGLLEGRATILRFATDNLDLMKGFFGDDNESLEEGLQLLWSHIKEKKIFPSYKDLVDRDQARDEELVMRAIEEMTAIEK